MNKLFTIAFLCAIQFTGNAQTPALINKEESYGQIDTTDLKLKFCAFEKDANAMVLFDIQDVSFDDYGNTTVLCHKRIKIFNDNGKDQADIRIVYNNITEIAAETINLNDKTIEYTPIDPALIYKQKITKGEKNIVFSFPNVRAGSIIELKYKWKIGPYILPILSFQSHIPTRYSKITVLAPTRDSISLTAKVNQPFTENTDLMIGNVDNYITKKSIRSLSNVASYKVEPYMTPSYDNIQRLIFNYTFKSWKKVASELLSSRHFNADVYFKLSDEKSIIKKVDSIKNKDAKIDTIFTMVKNRMLWNKVDYLFTEDGTQEAWDKKTGNSTEINLSLYRILTQAGIAAYPMVVSASENEIVDPDFPSLTKFNRTVVYVPVDSITYYVLDATNKHNTYNQIPLGLLSTFGFNVDPVTLKFGLVYIHSNRPASQLVFVNATIMPNGKLNGTADIISDSYQKTHNLNLYDKLGEEKYIGNLADNSNDMQIISLKREDITSDSLPLTQHVKFNLNLTASDENYIYFTPNLFTSFGSNPFLSETRYSNINFVYNNDYIISGIYKLPVGYEVNALPINQEIATEDKSMSFKRLMNEENGLIHVQYLIKRKRSYYSKNEYPSIYQFYKRMFQMLNEQIVLKKS